MSETGRKLRMLLAASVVLSVPAFVATASAHDPNSPYLGGPSPYPNTYQDPMSAHIEADQQHMAGERHHVWQEQRQRDEALRNGDLWGAWGLQQHINQERHHLRHEQEHVDHE